jgi:hypothetical protein
MSSELNVDTIVDKAGSGGATLTTPTLTGMSNTSTATSEGGAVTSNIAQSLVKAWVHAHQHDAQDSFNVASQTDTGTGDYTFTFTNSFGSDELAAASSNQSTRNGQGLYVGNFATSSFRINPSNSSGASADYDTSTVIAGDLA